MNSELKNLGFIESKNTKFFINNISKITELNNNNTMAIGAVSAEINGGFGISDGILIVGKKLNEEFIVEFVNSKNDTLFWEAILNSKIKEKREP